MAKTNEQITALDEKIKQLQAKKKRLVSKQKAVEQKARNQKRIKIGELVEKYTEGDVDLKRLEIFLRQNSELIKTLRL